MQVYVADYTADTQHLTCEEDGAYWRLLRAMWRAGGRLPNDPRKLAIICGLTPSKWKSVGPAIMALFDVESGDISQKRLSKELEKAHEKSAKRSEAGTKGAAAKSLKNNNQASANAEPLPKHSLEPEPEIEERETIDVSPKRSLAVEKPIGGFDEFWSEYPRKTAKDVARKAYASAIKRIDDIDPVTVILEGLRRAIPGWDDPKYIPHPTTWLNQGRWSDEAPQPRNMNGNHHGQLAYEPASSRHERAVSNLYEGAQLALAELNRRHGSSVEGG